LRELYIEVKVKKPEPPAEVELAETGTKEKP